MVERVADKSLNNINLIEQMKIEVSPYTQLMTPYQNIVPNQALRLRLYSSLRHLERVNQAITLRSDNQGVREVSTRRS